MVESRLRQTGMSELACQFARLIDTLNQRADPVVALTAAVLTEAVSQGHVCLNIHTHQPGISDIPETEEWLHRLRQSHVVGREGEVKPLILTERGLLYLYRHWQDEQIIVQAIARRCRTIELEQQDQVRQAFAQWPSPEEGIDWQKVAVLMALTQSFCIISGGPGTGKTTIVCRVLHMLEQQHRHWRIALAAPTGKAAARLQQAISQGRDKPIEAKTLHRLLKISTTQVNGRYDEDNPLPVDVLIVDEASMIDLGLMAQLMRALPTSARLILLGDSQQLASVEAGAVLANLCQEPPQFTSELIQLTQSVTGITLPAQRTKPHILANRRVELQYSYRFDNTSVVGQLARAVNAQSLPEVERILQETSPPAWIQDTAFSVMGAQMLAGYAAYFDAINQDLSASECLRKFEQYRVLTAVKHGAQSVASVNQYIEQHVQQYGWKSYQAFYHGRPIMITHNDYHLGLYNGDTGLILYNPHGVLKALFYQEGEYKWVDLHHLPAHDTAYAMTIHKSQGSEFDRVCIILPDNDSPLLGRELLYTAITRSRHSLLLVSRRETLVRTVQTKMIRETGLATRLSRLDIEQDTAAPD